MTPMVGTRERRMLLDESVATAAGSVGGADPRVRVVRLTEVEVRAVSEWMWGVRRRQAPC